MKNHKWMIGAALILILSIMGFKGRESVENVGQGRVIQFDKSKGIMKVIMNKNNDHLNPDYSALPPLVYNLPADIQTIGFIPKAGLRLELDSKSDKVVIFDEANQVIKPLTYTRIDQKENIAKNNPLILENGHSPKSPVIDRKKRLITIYSERQRMLTTFTLPAEYFSLPENTWEAGDEVLIHFQEHGQTRKVSKITKIAFMDNKNK